MNLFEIIDQVRYHSWLC